MTKLQQTISKRVNILTGEECPLGTIPNERCSGRTLSIALSLLAGAMSSEFRHHFLIDHAGDERRHADNLRYEVLGLISQAKLMGFKVEVRSTYSLSGMKGLSGLYGYSFESYGVYVSWDQIQDVYYDLRK